MQALLAMAKLEHEDSLPGLAEIALQVVVEVHGTNLEAAVALLQQEGGFQRVVAEQETDLRGSSLHMLYCTREV